MNEFFNNTVECARKVLITDLTNYVRQNGGFVRCDETNAFLSCDDENIHFMTVRAIKMNGKDSVMLEFAGEDNPDYMWEQVEDFSMDEIYNAMIRIC